MLATRPDIRSAGWISDNLPQESILLVNSFFAYGNSLIVGSDGGWWLPLLSSQNTTLPPLNYGSEQGPFPGYQQWVNALTRNIEQNGIDSREVIEMLNERSITHVFIGQRQGTVNANTPLLDTGELLASTYYEPVYHQDLVWIFQILY